HRLADRLWRSPAAARLGEVGHRIFERRKNVAASAAGLRHSRGPASSKPNGTFKMPPNGEHAIFNLHSPRAVNHDVGFMEKKIKLALVGAGMFGGDVHARAYADLQKAGISPQLGRIGLDAWARDFAPIQFELAAVAARSEKSAAQAQKNFKGWTGHKAK